MSHKDIYRQSRCPVCKRFFYDDQMKRDTSGASVCPQCFAMLLLQRERLLKNTSPIFPLGVGLVEILAMVAVLGILAAATIPSILRARQRATELELQLISQANQNTELGRLAQKVISGFSQGQPLQNISPFAKIPPEDVAYLEERLKKSMEIADPNLRIGAVIKAIEDWKREVMGRQ